MKNLLTVVALAFAMFAGMSNVQAQQLTQKQDRPEVVAKAKVANMNTELGLSGDQQRAMFRAYVAHESNMKKHVQGKDLSSPAVVTQKKKFDDVLSTSVKKVLSADQYKKWLALREQ